MSANLQYDASNQGKDISIFGSGDRLKTPAIQNRAISPSTGDRFAMQLIWVLISILLLLYLLASYFYWAKIEST